MGPINVIVQDANNLVLEVTPTPNTNIIVDRGIAGPIGLVWKGNWSSTTAYVATDAVYYAASNASYICISPNTNELPTNTTYWQLLVSGAGDVTGAASSTDNAIVRFDGTTGKLIQNSNVIIDDAGNLTYSAGTANGVAYLNGSKVLTTGSALTFDGAKLNNSSGSAAGIIQSTDTAGSGNFVRILADAAFGSLINFSTGSSLRFATSADNFGSFSEQMRLTSTGLGIGTSSPTGKFTAQGSVGSFYIDAGATGVAFTYNGGNYISALGGSNATLIFETGGAVERMRLDSSGNLGLGVTPSAWVDDKALQLPQGSVSSGYEYGISVAAGAYRSASNVWRYTQSAAGVSRFNQVNGAYQWFTAPSGTAGDAISFTQAMTLDSSGNLGVGTSSPAQKLSIQGASFVGASFNGQVIGDVGAERIRIGYKNGTPDTGLVPAQIIADTSLLQFASRDISTGAITFATGTGVPERMRLDSSGNLGIGTSSVTSGYRLEAQNGASGTGLRASNSGGGYISIEAESNATSNGVIRWTNDLKFIQGSTERMRIDGAGNVFTSNGKIGPNETQQHTMPSVASDTYTLNVATQTLTNKRVTPRSTEITSSATITPTGDTTDQYEVTALATAATIAAPSGTPTDGQKLVLRFKDNGTARALTWTTTSGAYRAVGVTLPTTTLTNRVLYVGCVWNAQDNFWDVIATAQQA